MDEISVSEVKSRSVRGVVILTGRTFILQIVSLVAQLVLWGYLKDYEFGVFAIVSAIINFLTYFSDIGLAAALVQKKEKPSDTDLRTTFTIQQFLVITLILVVFLISPYLVKHYSLSSDGKWLLYALSISFFLSSLKSIPSVILERRLEFIKLIFPQILEQVSYNLVLVFLAIKGFGLTSFAIAVLVRGVVGVLAIYILSPWLPGFALSFKSLKELFKFGIPYQVNTFLATFKDDGITLILGGILGQVGVGILSFAQKLARMPLTFFMDAVTRVTFPAFSRLQDQKTDLERSVTRSIFFICLLVFPSLMGMIIVAPILVRVIPSYNQWIPALTPLIFISINFMFAAATTQLTNLLNAIGKIKITFYLMIMWTVLTWVLIPALAVKFGVIGASVGYGLVGASSIIAIVIAKKHVNFSIINSTIRPLIASLMMGVILIFIRRFLPVSLYSAELLMVIGIAAYAVGMVSMMGMSLIEDAKRSLKTIFSR